MSAASVFDCLIIGGGPAGLSAAQAFARQLFRVVLFDAGTYGNDRASHMHNVASWDHRPPAEFRAAARQSIADRYSTIQMESTPIETVARASQLDSGSGSGSGSDAESKPAYPTLFQATDAAGRTWLARKLVLATGSRIIAPDMPGYSDLWGYRIYACLFCHGYEDRGAPSAGVLAVGPNMPPLAVAALARQARRLAHKVVVYTHGDASAADQLRRLLTHADFSVDARPLARLAPGRQASDVILHFQDGSQQTEGFLVHRPAFEVAAPFHEQLGLDMAETGDIKVSAPSYESSEPGVFAIGDCSTPMKAVVHAMASGAFCAGAVSHQLCSEMYS